MYKMVSYEKTVFLFNKINLPVLIWKLNSNGRYICMHATRLKEGENKSPIGSDLLEIHSIEQINSNYNIIGDNGLQNSIENKEIKQISKDKDKDLMPKIELKNHHSYQTDINVHYFLQLYDDYFLEILFPRYENENSKLLSAISKKLRVPLTEIIGVLSILGKILRIQDEEHLLKIEKSSNSLICLANDIIDIMKIENNSIKPEIKTVNLYNLIDDKVSVNFREESTAKGLQYICKIYSRVPEFIQTDPEMLSQILRILIKNAIENTTEGYIQLTVAVNEGLLILKIKDTGSGIKLSDQSLISCMFNYPTNHMFFPGFGLFIASHLTKELNGKISLSSNPEMGSIFTLIMKGVYTHTFSDT